MNNELFEYKYIESNSMSNMAIITKWFICAGNIEIPQTIGNNTIVFGIAANAFNLTDETESISIPESVKKIENDAFNLDNVSFGYCPVLKIIRNSKNKFEDLLLKKWYVIDCGWYHIELMFKNWMEYKDDSINFAYRKINASEIEIVKWFSPRDYITIPEQIDDKLKVVSLGKKSFGEIATLQKITVPVTVMTIKSKAFYYLNYEEYIYGDLYDLGWAQSGTPCNVCEIVLPDKITDICIDAFLHGTELRCRRHRKDGYNNRLIISTVDNSETLNWFLNMGWRIAEKQDEYVRLLMDEENGGKWIEHLLFIEPKNKKWVSNWICFKDGCLKV